MIDVKWNSLDRTATGGPLAGLRVIEFSHVLAGPICGQLLADMGAEVIKVERPPKGDTQRWDVAAEDNLGPYSASFFTLNRGKRSLVLDLKQEQHRAVAFGLIEDADVLVQNYRVGTLDRLGFGFDELRTKFPQLIYCSISGFGQTGPWADRGGFDLVAQAMSGIMSFTGSEGSEEPIKCGAPMTDIASGILGVCGILAALHRRNSGGEGEHVDIALLDAGVMFTYLQSSIAMASGSTPGPLGSGHPLYAPYEAFPVSDGWIALGTANDDSWKRLLAILEVPELATDTRFQTTASRVENRSALYKILAPRFLSASRDHWVETLAQSGIPCGPVLNVPEMLQHPQILHREMVLDVPHPDGGNKKAIGCPIKFSLAERVVPKPAPLLNEH